MHTPTVERRYRDFEAVALVDGSQHILLFRFFFLERRRRASLLSAALLARQLADGRATESSEDFFSCQLGKHLLMGNSPVGNRRNLDGRNQTQLERQGSQVT